jgi:transposase, IS5 family
MLVPAVARVAARFNKVPKAVTADRGYGEAKVESELESLGVKHVAIPRKGRPGAQRQAVESSRRFRKLVKWRTGSEGRISHLKHSWGWERTMLDGIDGASTWCGWGVLAHNATKISVLIEERETTETSAGAAPTRRPTATGPPGRPPPTTRNHSA